MSQSPADSSDFDDARNEQSEYRKSLTHLNRLLNEGASLSGHERNCAFLNVPESDTFANVSAVTGFDFADDARGMAVSDWDSDGDLDVWVSNRTAPRVRFLRNELTSDNHFLIVRLQGVACNRDAIGSRVQVYLKGQPEQPLVKTLRAGEGFLSQSSKWLHFGLGNAAEIDRVVVSWPGGNAEVYSGLGVDQRYRLVQGNATPQLVSRPVDTIAIQPEPQPTLPQTNLARVSLSSRLPAPRLPYRTFAREAGPKSEEASIVQANRPILVNLWASWCAPCLQELDSFRHHEQELRAAGLDIVAIAVDAQIDSSANDTQDTTAPEELVRRIGFPFTAGVATDELIRRLRTIFDLPFATRVEMPVPSSFLLDSQGRVSVMYRGPVSVDQLLSDVSQLNMTDGAWQTAAFPFAGKWNEPPAAVDILTIPRTLLDRSQTTDALAYVKQNHKELAQNREYPKLLTWLGDQLMERERSSDAIEQYRSALQLQPNDINAINNFAWQLATHPDSNVRNGRLAVKWAERAAKITHSENPAILDTLAASYAEAQQFDKAVTTLNAAMKIAARTDQTAMLKEFRSRLIMYRQKRAFRDR